jgi:hypothetical protein
MALAFPAEKSRCCVIIARDAFTSALDDVQFEKRIREREPADLEAAYILAVKLESLDRALECSDDVGPKTCRQVRDDGGGDVLLQVKRQLEQQKTELVELQAAVKAIVNGPSTTTSSTFPAIDQTRHRGIEKENKQLRRDVE